MANSRLIRDDRNMTTPSNAAPTVPSGDQSGAHDSGDELKSGTCRYGCRDSGDQSHRPQVRSRFGPRRSEQAVMAVLIRRGSPSISEVHRPLDRRVAIGAMGDPRLLVRRMASQIALTLRNIQPRPMTEARLLPIPARSKRASGCSGDNSCARCDGCPGRRSTGARPAAAGAIFTAPARRFQKPIPPPAASTAATPRQPPPAASRRRRA